MAQGNHARVLSQPEVSVLQTVPGHGLVSHVPVVGVVHEHGPNVGVWHLPLYVRSTEIYVLFCRIQMFLKFKRKESTNAVRKGLVKIAKNIIHGVFFN